MKQVQLRLLSDATFGRGDGVPGLVDNEIEYDQQSGLPRVKGRTLKGLITEECSNLLFAMISFADRKSLEQLHHSAQMLFGSPGSRDEDEGRLHFGTGSLHPQILYAIEREMSRPGSALTADEVLMAATGVRRQSAVDHASDAPASETLRSARVLVRETVFFFPLTELSPLNNEDWQLLTVCVATLRRGGKNRNRGCGRLECRLFDNDQDRTIQWSDELLNRVFNTGEAP